MRPNSGPENGMEREKDLLGEGDTCRARIRIEYDNLEARMKSFDSWPSSLRPRPEELSAAGFFYTGSYDKTTCFVCGLTVWKWLPTDDPWIEHCRWASRCTYIALNKGKRFIEDTVAKRPRILNPESATGARVPGYEGSDDTMLCKICNKDKLGVLFLPCSHLVACVKCGPVVSNCILCNQHIEAAARVSL